MIRDTERWKAEYQNPSGTSFYFDVHFEDGQARVLDESGEIDAYALKFRQYITQERWLYLSSAIQQEELQAEATRGEKEMRDATWAQWNAREEARRQFMQDTSVPQTQKDLKRAIEEKARIKEIDEQHKARVERQRNATPPNVRPRK